VAVWRATGKPPVWRIILVPLAAVVIVAAGAVPLVAMGLLCAVLAGVAAIEHRRFVSALPRVLIES
jgi:hypothetical protein